MLRSSPTAAICLVGALAPLLASAYVVPGLSPMSVVGRSAIRAGVSSRKSTASFSASPLFSRSVRTSGPAIVNLRASIKTHEKGSFPSEEYRVFFQKNGKDISPWHDIPTWADKDKNIINAVIEITKNTRPKMEVATKQALNPIKQDMKKGKLRDYPLDIFWNYGMIPQTWENPNEQHPELKANGDDDPVDIVEIGSAPLARGAVVQVKAIGTLAMIDEGELDWKVIGINTADPKANKISNVADIEREFPGQIAEIRDWFRNYKSNGKYENGKWVGVTEGINSFGLGEKCMDYAYTKTVIEETAHQYANLKAGKIADHGLSLH